jgi:putative serine/threonine protein kinase|tara:strand:- start:4565 stop:5155 length:591 start_codon:yes stop_codon:yes gene_type:complete
MIEIKNEKYFAEGKRSIVYIGLYKNKKVIIKKPKSNLNTIQHEARFLKILNKYNIGPKLIYHNEEVLIVEYIKGLRIIDWLKINNKNKIKIIFKKILDECKLLDKLKINKKELTNPYKHIIINKNPIMIDFERCRFVENPKNLTQFCQFLMSKNVYEILKEKKLNFDKIRLMKELKKYKQNNKNYNLILKIIMEEF